VTATSIVNDERRPAHLVDRRRPRRVLRKPFEVDGLLTPVRRCLAPAVDEADGLEHHM